MRHGLLRDGAMRPIDVGARARAREQEALGYLHIVVRAPLGSRLASAVKLVEPSTLAED